MRCVILIKHWFFNSVHYVKNPGAVLEPGSVVAKLELDDPSKVTQVKHHYIVTETVLPAKNRSLSLHVYKWSNENVSCAKLLQTLADYRSWFIRVVHFFHTTMSSQCSDKQFLYYFKVTVFVKNLRRNVLIGPPKIYAETWICSFFSFKRCVAFIWWNNSHSLPWYVSVVFPGTALYWSVSSNLWT